MCSFIHSFLRVIQYFPIFRMTVGRLGFACRSVVHPSIHPYIRSIRKPQIWLRGMRELMGGWSGGLEKEGRNSSRGFGKWT